MNSKVARARVSFRICEDAEIAFFEVFNDDSVTPAIDFEIPLKEFVKLMFMRYGCIKSLSRVYDTFAICDKKREHMTISVPATFKHYGEEERMIAFNEWLGSEQCAHLRTEQGYTEFKLNWGAQGDSSPSYFKVTAYRWRDVNIEDLDEFSRSFKENFNSETGEFTMLSDSYYNRRNY